jgi:deazaflavin-dependent oxidoreductase (nitroreductase family)
MAERSLASRGGWPDGWEIEREEAQMLPKSRRRDALKDALTKRFARLHVALYRRTGGTTGGRFRGAPTLLLTTVGRRSGQRRVNPLLYLEDGEQLVVVASNGGDHRHPGWYLNLLADPEVTVQVGRATHRVTAATAPPELRARLWPRLVALYPDYETYQGRTDREMPVVVLSPAG